MAGVDASFANAFLAIATFVVRRALGIPNHLFTFAVLVCDGLGWALTYHRSYRQSAQNSALLVGIANVIK